MNSLSIDSHFFVSPLLAPSRSIPGPLISGEKKNLSPRRSQPPRLTTARWFSPVEDRFSNGLSVGLFALTLSAVGCAFYQLWHLVGGETLTQAVRAFAP